MAWAIVPAFAGKLPIDPDRGPLSFVPDCSHFHKEYAAIRFLRASAIDMSSDGFRQALMMRAGDWSRSGVGVWNRRAYDDPVPCTSSKVVPDTVGTKGDAIPFGVRIRCAPRRQSSTCHQGPHARMRSRGSAWRARSPCARTNLEHIHRNAQKITERSVPDPRASQIKLLCPSTFFCGCIAVLRESKTKITLTTDFTDYTDEERPDSEPCNRVIRGSSLRGRECRGP